MSRDEFMKEYVKIVLFAVQCSEKARHEGFLALESELDQEKIDARDIFHLGLRLFIDRIDDKILKKILLNIVKQEKDEYAAILQKIKKAAVLSIHEGFNSRMLCFILNSYTNIPLDEDEALNKLLKE
jgi:flagellar motor component MotA